MKVPLDIMRRCAQVAAGADRIAVIGNPNLITDAGVSAILAEAACAAARLNVEINLKFLDDADLRQETDAQMAELTQQVSGCRESVAATVAGHLKGQP
jgi:glutamate formiminotransferase/formiminotetrahydrofolate cyclodeaminase